MIIERMKAIIESYLRYGEKSFVIYAYGYNGLHFHEILKGLYGIEPAIIVDNHLCHYNSSIRSGFELRKLYKDEMVVIITISDPYSSFLIRQELSGFVHSGKICWLFEDEDCFFDESNRWIDKFNIYNLMPQIGEQKDKIRFLLAADSKSFGNIVPSVIEAFQKDQRWDILLISDDKHRPDEFQNVRRINYVDYDII